MCVFEEFVVVFGDKKFYVEIIQFFKVFLEWFNFFIICCIDVIYCYIYCVVMVIDEKFFVWKFYVEVVFLDILVEDMLIEEFDI